MTVTFGVAELMVPAPVDVQQQLLSDVPGPALKLACVRAARGGRLRRVGTVVGARRRGIHQRDALSGDADAGRAEVRRRQCGSCGAVVSLGRIADDVHVHRRGRDVGVLGHSPSGLSPFLLKRLYLPALSRFALPVA